MVLFFQCAMNLFDVIASAQTFLGPVKVISKKDIVFPYREYNDATLKDILKRIGWHEGERIAFISTYDPTYTRTEALRDLFARNSVPVEYFFYSGATVRCIGDLFRLRREFRCFVVGFRGHHILPFVRATLGKEKRIIFDAFVSVFDTLCCDRQIVAPHSTMGRFFHWYDRWLSDLSDVVLVDTQTHRRYFEKEFHCRNVFPLYVDCNRALFSGCRTWESDEVRKVLWYGNCLPLQGVENILRWVKSLNGRRDIRFRFIGPVRERYGKHKELFQLQNAEFLSWVPYDALPEEIRNVDLCIGGHFSDRAKARRVIAGKTFQMLSCGARVLVADNEAHAEILCSAASLHAVP